MSMPAVRDSDMEMGGLPPIPVAQASPMDLSPETTLDEWLKVLDLRGSQSLFDKLNASSKRQALLGLVLGLMGSYPSIQAIRGSKESILTSREIQEDVAITALLVGLGLFVFPKVVQKTYQWGAHNAWTRVRGNPELL